MDVDRIRTRLKLVGPGPAVMFADACELMSRSPVLATTSHLVAHLLREILSSLEQVLFAVSAPPALQVADAASLGADGDGLRKGDSHASKVRAILDTLGMDPQAEPGTKWIEIAQLGFAGAAHRRALDPPRPVDEGFRAEWQSALVLLSVVLERYEARFLAWRTKLDELLGAQTPGRKHVSALRNIIPNNPQNLEYFFTRAGAQWLESLVRQQYFSVAPDTDVDPDGKAWRYPPWPPITYLKRMAASPGAGPVVVSAVQQIPLTDNTFTWMGVLETAAALPPEQAAALAPYLVHAFKVRALLSIPHLAEKLIVRLATSGFGPDALVLARAALAISAEADAVTGAEPTRRRPTTALDSHELDSLLRNATAPLAGATGAACVELFSDLLEQALSIEFATTAYEDHSGVWRRDIAHDERTHEVSNSLVTAVRDAALHLLRASNFQVGDLVRLIESRRWRVFRRLALYILGRVSPAPTGLIEQRLIDPELWEQSDHEYRSLLHDCFGQLSESARNQILTWIDTGPERGVLVERFRFWKRREPQETDIDIERKRWQVKRLLPLAAQLDSGWGERFRALANDLGIAPPAWSRETGPRDVVLQRPATPKSAGELSAMPTRDLAEWLRTWMPPETPFGWDASDLADQLSRAVSANPAPFAAGARDFVGVLPIYVSRVLDGFSGAAVDAAIEWEPVLDLSVWASSTIGEADPDNARRYLRSAVASLMIRLLQKRGALPLALRQKAWRVIELLSTDADPAQERETRDGATPYEVGLNSVRGQAVRAAVNYALWVAQQRNQPSESGLSVAPEVRGLIDRHLDLEFEPSAAVRSIIASHLPWLVALDPSWGATVASVLFAADVPARLRDAAWNAYVMFAPGPDPRVWHLVEAEYQARVSALSSRDPDSKPGKADVPWDGTPCSCTPAAGSNSAAPLLRASSEAPPAVCGDESWSGWRTLDRPEDVPAAAIERLQHLWEWRVQVTRSDPGSLRSDLSAAALWYGTKRFPKAWADQQLLAACDLGVRVYRSEPVFEDLAERIRAEPHVAFELARKLLDAVTEEWEVLASREHIRTILSTAVRDEQLRVAAIEVVNRLAARGHSEFADLVPHGGGRPEPSASSTSDQ